MTSSNRQQLTQQQQQQITTTTATTSDRNNNNNSERQQQLKLQARLLIGTRIAGAKCEKEGGEIDRYECEWVWVCWAWGHHGLTVT